MTKNMVIESNQIVSRSVLSSVDVFVKHASNKVRVREMTKVLRT